MSHGVALLLLSLLLFELKHFIFDFVLQTTYLYQNKGIYGHRAGFIHAGLHAIGSLPPVLIITQNVTLVAAIVVVEFLVHYHVDWLKLRLDKGLTPDQGAYWTVFGADQLIHQVTYTGILAVLAQNAHF